MVTRRTVLLVAPVGAAAAVIGAKETVFRGEDSPGAQASGTISTTSTSATTTLTPTTTTATSGPTTTATPYAAARWARRTSNLKRALTAYPTPSKVTFALALTDGRTGRSFAFRGAKEFETASIVKVNVLATALLQAQDAGTKLSERQKALATRMIRYSDNNATDALWSDIGGVSGLARANRRLGLTDTEGKSYSWGLTTTNVLDQVRLINEIAAADGHPLRADKAEYELDLMETVASDQDWGVSAAARKGERTAVKNGWLPRSTIGRRWIINSIGRIEGRGADLRMAVLTRGHLTQQRGIDFVEDVAQLARKTLAL